jgi:hypothetical protein
VDYEKFLSTRGKTEHVVLAYLGGPYAYGKDRRYRIAEPRPPSGFHRFEVRGRDARAVEAVESPDASVVGGLPKLRGHHLAGWLVDANVHRLALLPAEELPPFAIVRARRWHSGDHVFESRDFDGEVEEAARLRLERLEPIADLKGVPSSLRIAFGTALGLAVARREGVVVTHREISPHAFRLAEGGGEVARELVTNIERRRVLEADRIRERVLVHQRAQQAASIATAAERAERALDAAHARMLSSRNLGDGNLEVAWEFMDERFISVVDALSLHVYDSGVCLAGEDELVTLESLPSVIREAIETGALVITRH